MWTMRRSVCPMLAHVHGAASAGGATGTSARVFAGGWKRPGGSAPAGASNTGAGADRSAKSESFC